MNPQNRLAVERDILHVGHKLEHCFEPGRVVEQHDIGLAQSNRAKGIPECRRGSDVIKILVSGQHFDQPFENDGLRFTSEYRDTAQ